MSDDPIQSLYVHVPFCAHKCEYCAFYSKLPTNDLVGRYVDALIREMEMIAEDCAAQTIFFGGGTPSLLSLKQWRKILGAMKRLGLDGADEWTVECNPATVSTDKAMLLRDAGVNRISMGVQSLDESLLDRLGRIHSRKQVFKSYEILRSAGFENINLDLMFGIPGQDHDIWERTLTEAINLSPEHLSSYEVIYEEDTPLFEQLKAGQFEVDEDLVETMYERLVELAESNGYRQYEVANFASHNGNLGEDDNPDKACRHNINYWRGASFHGLGPSATGYVRGKRSKNWANTQLYCDLIEQGKRAFDFNEELSPLARAGETAAFGLRMNRGWRFDEFDAATGFDLRHEWAPEMEELCDRGLGLQTANGFRLSTRGHRLADAAGSSFLRIDPNP
ncbi:MAG: coproporphyrinogen III oxidase [Verrucomicrobiales bacterium]|nr:coproporphyrinogen III oxidase [Verrucomicrobiales bacterium]